MQDRIVGRNSVLALLRRRNREIECILIAEGNDHPRLRQIQSEAAKKSIRCEPVPRQELDRVEPTVPHQGVIAVVGPISYTDLETVLENAKSNPEPTLLIMLDQIQDPRNLGAIIRTAEAVNADGLILPKDRAAGVTAAAHKTAAGSSEYIPIAQVTNLARTIETLKKRAIWVVGANQEAPTRYTEADFTAPTCLVLGNEADGLRRLIREKCDLLVRLPMFGHVPSLNVSVAAGVLLYEALRQRSRQQTPPES